LCRYARQDKHWVTGPDTQRRENYVVLAVAHPELEGKTDTMMAAAAAINGCCGATHPSADTVTASGTCCA